MKRLYLILGVAFSTLNAQVSPLLNTTWNQGCYYNANCPTDAAGPCSRVYTGCNATALAQILKFWNHPATGWGAHSYTPSGYPLQSANFGATTYSFAGMPNNVSSANAQVAQLMYHLGVSVDMAYGASQSNSGMDMGVLKKYFKYSVRIKGAMKAMYTNIQWENLIKSELDAGRVIFASGGSHFYLIDGYQTTPTLQFHINWGWGGLYNGYYDIHNTIAGGINYTPSNLGYNIYPLTQIETSVDTIIVGAAASNASFEMSSLTGWTVTSDQPWCTPALGSGIAGYFNYVSGASVSCTANPTYVPRTATVTYNDGTNTADVVIIQQGITPSVSTSPGNLIYSSAPSGQTVNIYSDSSWTAFSTDPWISPSSSAGSGNSFITANVTANPSATARTGTLVVQRGSLQSVVSIYQAGNASYWCIPAMTASGSNGITNVTVNTINRTSLNNETYVLTGDTTLLKLDSTYNISVTFVGSNAPAIWLDYNIDGDFNDTGEDLMPPAGTWYPSFASTKNFNFTVPAGATEGITKLRVYSKNFGTGPVVSPCETTDLGGDIEDYTIIIQDHRHISATPSSLNFTNNGPGQSISIDSDSSWISSSPSWISVSPAVGTGNTMVGISVDTNYSTIPRSGVVQFIRGSKLTSVSVQQAGEDTLLQSVVPTINFSSLGGVQQTDIASNVAYNIISTAPWLTLGSLTASGNFTLDLIASSNTTLSVRNAMVIYSSGTYADTLFVTQNAASAALTATPDSMFYSFTGGIQNLQINTVSSWSLSTPQSWINTNVNSGTGNTLVDVDTDTNLTAMSRYGIITITNGISMVEVYVEQEPNLSGLEEISSGFALYPNPASESVFIHSFQTPNQMMITDLKGSILKSFSVPNSLIEVNDLNNGVYLVILFYPDSVSVQKLVVCH